MGQNTSLDSVSQRAMYLARLIDRLEPGGKYSLNITVPPDKTGTWAFELTQNVTIQRRDLVPDKAENAKQGNSPLDKD